MPIALASQGSGGIDGNYIIKFGVVPKAEASYPGGITTIKFQSPFEHECVGVIVQEGYPSQGASNYGYVQGDVAYWNVAVPYFDKNCFHLYAGRVQRYAPIYYMAFGK